MISPSAMLLCSEDGGNGIIRKSCYVFLRMYMLYTYQNTGFFVQFCVSGLRSFKNVNYNKFTTDWPGTRRFPTPDEFNYFKNILLLSGNKTLLELQQD